jgi:hypothetical protein
MFEHSKAMRDETESGEVRKNGVRETDCGNCIELRTTQSGVSNGREVSNGLGLTKGSFLTQ